MATTEVRHAPAAEVRSAAAPEVRQEAAPRVEPLPVVVVSKAPVVVEARVPAAVGLPVTAVDARLWSAAPTFLNIEPTTRCNFSCWYCIGRHMVQADIEVDNFARMLDNYPSVKAIALVGDGQLKASLQEQVARDGLTNVFFFDLMPKLELVTLLSLIHI